MASEDIIERLTSRFSSATSNLNTPDIGTRNIGGSQRQNHPYISGYFQAIFKLPDAIFTTNTSDAIKYLTSTCESFTPPSESINYTELTGLGQVKSRFYTYRGVTNDISLAFREYTNMPIMNIFNLWTGFIDPFVGVSSFTGSQFLPSNYKGILYVMQTKPVGAYANNGELLPEDIEESWIFDGVWPTTLPYQWYGIIIFKLLRHNNLCINNIIS